MRRLTALMVTACCAMGAAACGDDEDGGGAGAAGGSPTTAEPAATTPSATAPQATVTTPPATTRPEPAPPARMNRAAFISRADAVCTTAEIDGGKLKPKGNPLEDPAAAAAYLVEIEKIGRTQLEGLQALEPPAALAGDYAKLLKLEQEAVGIIAAAARKAKASDASAAQDLNQLGALSRQIKRTGAGMGITKCS